MTQKVLGQCTEGLLFIVSAPAGTGKTTLIQKLHEEFPCVIQSISYTTRSPRPEEVDGVHYHFVGEKEFQQKVSQGDFLEHVELYGTHYGTSRVWVESELKQGKHVVLVIDTQGALKLKGMVPHISIFLMPPSLQELERRLTERDTESENSIEQRLAWAKREMAVRDKYDYNVINDDLDVAYEIIRSIFIAEEHRMLRPASA